MIDESRYPNLARVGAALSSVPHARFLGISCDEIGPGRAVLSMPYRSRLIGNYETAVLHGGVITALLDTLSWLVVSAVVRKNRWPPRMRISS